MFEFALKHVQEDVLVLGNTDSEKRGMLIRQIALRREVHVQNVDWYIKADDIVLKNKQNQLTGNSQQRKDNPNGNNLKS